MKQTLLLAVFSITAAPPSALPVSGFLPARPPVMMSSLSQGTPLPQVGNQPIRLTSTRTQDGVSTIWEIAPARASALPRWDPESFAPSLSTVEAAATARTWLAQRNPQIQRFDLQSVGLSRVRRGADLDLWFYQVDFFGYGAAVPPGGPLFKAIVLPDGSVLEPARSGGADGPPPGVYRAGPGITIPRALREVRPNYTAEALRRKISGAVFVEGVVGTDGGFHDLRVSRSLDAVYGLDEEALKAAAQWRFTPGTRDGQPVPVMVTVELTFTVKK